MISFQINGRTVSPNNIRDVLEKAMLEGVEAQLRQRIGLIRDPETGEFPTLVVSGPSLSELSIKVEGSPELVAQVKARLSGDDEVDEEMTKLQPEAPKAFLSFTWDDKPLAEQIATALMASGIETFWAPWCIGPGDSFREKIEEGLGDCTHFIVLMTPNSIGASCVTPNSAANLEKQAAASVTKIESAARTG
ncbi:MAG: toll/interleukin-1 receptor domain-containing protein [Rhodospirillaceae bacterium]